MLIAVIRHGESTANAQGIIQGHHDYSLSKKGKKQAQKLALKLKKRKYNQVNIYSSDLSRAKETANIIAQVLKPLTLQSDKRLREQHLGDYQGKKRLELQEKDHEFFDQIYEDHDLRIPSGETVNEMKMRIKDFWDEFLLSEKNSEKSIIIGHGGTLYHILHHILNIFPDTDEWFYNCSFNEIEYDKEKGTFSLIRFNGKEI